MISDPLRNDALVAVGMVQVVKGIRTCQQAKCCESNLNFLSG